MKTFSQCVSRLSVVIITSIAFIGGCGEEKKPTPAPKPAVAKDDHAGHDHAGHDHGKKDHAPAPEAAPAPESADDHGPTTQLGEQVSGAFTVKASRDGALTAGGEAPIDVWVSSATDKVHAVRFWIGTEDGKGSMKAKAELEKDNWHTHAEVPNPIPAQSKLWVEVENEKREKIVVGFDLKQ